jgi:hypothetical protein
MSKQNNTAWDASVISEAMAAGYVLLEHDRSEDACKIWLDLWELIKQSAPADIKKVEDLDKLLAYGFSIHYWAQELAMALEYLGDDDPEFQHVRIRFCKEFWERLPECNRSVPPADLRITPLQAVLSLGGD